MVGWLLDRGPGELRSSPIRNYPVALAALVQHLVASNIDGVRAAYRSARVELRDHLSPEEVTVAQAALEAQGALLLQTQREVALVAAALRGPNATEKVPRHVRQSRSTNRGHPLSVQSPIAHSTPSADSGCAVT